MRICIVHQNLEAGGAERQLIQLALQWQGMGHHVEVVLLEHQGVWLNDLDGKIIVRCLSQRLPRNSILRIYWMWWLVTGLRQYFLQHPFDVVLTFLWLPTLISAFALRQMPERPMTVWSVQSDLVQEFRLHRDGWVRQWLVRTFLPGHIDHFIAISSGIKLKTKNLLGVSAERFTIIPNSLNLAQICKMAVSQGELPDKTAATRMVSVGRLHPAKGMDVLLEALALVRNEMGNWECYILGDGPERERLSQLARQLNLNNHVHFVGYAQNPYTWLETADLFVLPSRWETFGIAIIEAMALGLPVIATATDGASDIITHDVDGYLVPVGDAQALALAIKRLINEPKLRQRLGRNAKARAKVFDVCGIAQKYISLFNRRD
ncbi:Glycosyl transferase, family 1 [Moorella glycerini]|uniref:4-alpha-N-acetylgalactosaminyltransferase n=1 Tax=Neomoorella stamsii TaxID=1266720 RepID=A0A9X7J3K4_9FIRM|nr:MULTISPECIES: glycosyltransferase [Moorella]PRR73801.1 4-alpha-N-acetylgalactosaminyltransferase [Moorella stamsii]CEP67181.1 Glycosyl transferase, family 1 [Moorella glycerini]